MNTRSKLISSFACAVAIFAAPLTINAQSVFPGYGAPLSLSNAQMLINAAKTEAAKNKWNMAIAIVDSGGALVALERMDDTLLASSQIAIDKARTANGFKRPTKALQDAVTSGFTPILALTGATPIDGGLPIVINGKIVGAIGVSGASPSEDGVVATAGLNALKTK
jgi:glc operon protein GlcG